MAGDLHTHTNFSDGSTDIEDLLKLASRAKLTHIAVSDHDTEFSIQFAMANPIVDGVQLLCATELTCFDEARGNNVHMLCYLPNLTQELLDFFDNMRKKRNRVIEKSLTRLEEIYPLFSRDAALKYSERSKVTFKTHLMRVLFECGYTDGVYKALYSELFASKKGEVMCEPDYDSVDFILKLIKGAGGVAVFAHPSVYDSLELVQELAQAGKIDGVEIYHPRNNQQDIARLLEIAEKYSLIVTGGSDFHGICMSKPSPLASFTTSCDEIEKIITLAKNRKA